MDNEPTTLFESYESDFLALINGVREKLEGEAKEQRGGLQFFLVTPIAISHMERSLRAAQSHVEEGGNGTRRGR